MTRGFGVAGGLDPDVAGPLAERCAELGYGSLWSNDTPIGNGLETVAAFATTAPEIELGVTIAIDRHPPEEVAADVERLALDPERLLLAVGAGHSRRALTAMREALPRYREALPGFRLILAGMGPKMCRLAGSDYDGAFFNWITPGFAAKSRANVERGAADAGRETPPVFGYVRTAVGADAAARLLKEESFYRGLHEGYRNHFTRLGEPEGTVGIAAPGRDEAQRALAAYEALDVPVVRALASATVEAMTALADATAPDA